MIAKIKCLLVSFAGIALMFHCLSPGLTFAATAQPSDVIKTFNDTLLEAMKKAEEIGYSGRYKLLGPVIKESFALSFMCSQSAGRYWKNLKTNEKEELLGTYADWTVASYAGRFDGYSGEKFEIASEKGPSQGTVTVVSNLVKQDGETVKFHYSLRRIEDRWRIVDIQISGVSQLALTRAQFTGVIRDKGVAGLIANLEDKIRGFEGRGKK